MEILLGSHTKCKSHERSSRLSSSVFLQSRIRSRKLSEIGVKFRHVHSKSGSPSKNMTSDFAPEVAKYPKNILP